MYNFKRGEVIAGINKKYIYPNIYDQIKPIYSLVEIERIVPLFQPKEIKDENVGAIILIYLKSKEESSVSIAIEKLKESPYIVFAEPNYIEDIHRHPNDQYFRYLWGMDKIQTPLAWNYGTGSFNVMVGVVDSGVDYNHPDIVNNLLISPGTVYRWYDNPMDETGHGTHVAGTIGAVGNNYIGVAGLCWDVKIISLKIGNLSFNLAAAIRAIDYANEYNISILNNSWGGIFYSDALKYAIDNYDGLFIASAGNSRSNNDILPVYPASYDCDNIISVAATNQYDDLAFFSNYGATSVDIAAPGEGILSTDLHGEYSYMSGTSMAAPHVAGAAALLKSYNTNLTTLEMKDIILSSVDKRPRLFGRVITDGTLNVYNMMQMASARTV